MAEVGKLSVTKTLLYQRCPFAYYLKYIAKEKVLDRLVLLFGRDIHYMLKRFYEFNYKTDESLVKFWKRRLFEVLEGKYLKGKAKENLTVREYMYYAKNKETERRERKFIRIGSHIEDLSSVKNVPGIIFGYMNVGENILRKFCRRHQNRPKPYAFEWAFGKRKDEPVFIGDHLVTGVIDRIDRMNRNWFITDYKTSRKAPSHPDALREDPQFTFYSNVFRQLFGESEIANIYYHLRSGITLKTYRNEKDFSKLIKTLDETAGGIYTDKFDPSYSGDCISCDYLDPCRAYEVLPEGLPRKVREIGTYVPEIFDWDAEVPEWIESQVDER